MAEISPNPDSGRYRCSTVLLYSLLHEGALGVDTGALGLSAEGLVASKAVVALVARGGDPLDTNAVTDLELGDGVVDGDDDSGTLVASNAGALSENGPLVLDNVEVGLESERVVVARHLRGRHPSRGP